MPLPQHITRGHGGTIRVEFAQTETSATVVIVDGAGQTKVNETAATWVGLSTDLSGAVTAGGTSIVVSSAADFTSGLDFWVLNPREHHRCKSLSGTTVTLWAPLLYDHPDSSVVESTEFTLTVTSDQANAQWFDGWAKWTPGSGAAPVYTGVECTPYELPRIANQTDLTTLIPTLADQIDDTEDVNATLDAAHADVLSMLGARSRARVSPASREFVRATCYRWAVNHFGSLMGPTAREMEATFADRLNLELQALSEIVPQDPDGDGLISETEQRGYRSREIIRR